MHVTGKGQITIPKRIRVAAARVRSSLSPEFKQLGADEIMAFLRSDTATPTASRRGRR
jgi:hypothetical protein